MTAFALCPTMDKINHQNDGPAVPPAASRLPEIIQRAEFRNGFHQLQTVA